MSSARLKIAVAVSVAVLALAASAYPFTTGYGSITDPIGDNSPGTPDIASASVTIDSSGTALFSLTYAPGTSLNAAAGTWNLDTDKNPATGWPGVDSAHNDSALMGTDFIVAVYGSSFQADADVLEYVQLTNSWASNGAFPVTYAGTTEEVTVPLSDLGGGDGSMNFVVVSQTQLTDDSFTGIGDYAPDLGLAPGSVTAVPEPATLSLLALGLAGLVAKVARRRNR